MCAEYLYFMSYSISGFFGKWCKEKKKIKACALQAKNGRTAWSLTIWDEPIQCHDKKWVNHNMTRSKKNSSIG